MVRSEIAPTLGGNHANIGEVEPNPRLLNKLSQEIVFQVQRTCTSISQDLGVEIAISRRLAVRFYLPIPSTSGY